MIRGTVNSSYGFLILKHTLYYCFDLLAWILSIPSPNTLSCIKYSCHVWSAIFHATGNIFYTVCKAIYLSPNWSRWPNWNVINGEDIMNHPRFKTFFLLITTNRKGKYLEFSFAMFYIIPKACYWINIFGVKKKKLYKKIMPKFYFLLDINNFFV